MTTLPDTMAAAILESSADGGTALQWQQIAVPQPAAGQLLLQVAAAGINRADLMQRRGQYPPPASDSNILGLEVSGVVVAVGSNADHHWLGKKVFGLVNGGGYAAYALMPSAQAMLVPDSWSLTEAAGCAETFLTAYQLLFSLGQLHLSKAHLTSVLSGQKVLIHAGASGVGTAAICLASLAGAEVAVTASSDEKLAVCHSLGARHGFNYQQQDFVSVLKQLWPPGCQLILDPVAGDYIAKNIQCLAIDGKIVVYALMGGRRLAELDLAPLFQKRGQILCSTLRNRSPDYKAELSAAFYRRFAAEMQQRRLIPLIHRVFSYEEVEQAHQLMASNHTMGKLILLF
ncbi:NAD(P)H-quinone oxidoreductase [Arsukibacterium sp.]|uniref:NAD(P)H-quinone oxidoreductase n=1 Tax=Arsukibacterium sp. TaxID=1977258 RepID=UPI002FD9D885